MPTWSGWAVTGHATLATSHAAPDRDNVRSMEQQDAVTDQVEQDTLVEEELLVEEISIDGMCGVY